MEVIVSIIGVLFFVAIYLFPILIDIYDTYSKGKKYNELSNENRIIKNQLENLKKENKNMIVDNAIILDLQDIIEKQQNEINNIKNDNCASRLYRLAEQIAEKELEDFDNLIVYLENKNNPAFSSAQKVQEAKNKAKDFEIKYKMMKYEYDILFEVFPELENYLSYGTGKEELETVKKYFDRTSNWLSKEEYYNLSDAEKNQLALDRYVEKFTKSKWQIGRDYEMSVAHSLKEKGYNVEYFGIDKKLNDLGRDIIAENNKEILIIQCKYWSKEKVIHEKHICQLYGSTIQYKMQNKTKKKIIPVFVTYTKLSETAKLFAKYLGIKVYENEPLKEFPRIKCNINHTTKEKIYHLPFDQQYDVTKIDTKKGESFEYTVAQAELKGFRRAKKWIYP